MAASPIGPSGREPIVHLGSRRGVPYRSKITSTLHGEPPRLEVLQPELIARLSAASGTLDFTRDVWPHLATEQLFGYYRELFTGHPERVRGSWADFAARLHELAWDSPELLTMIEQAVPDAADRFDLVSFHRPLGDERFSSPDELQERLRAHIRADLASRTSQAHSATQGLFLATLFAFMAMAEIPVSAWSARSRAISLPRDWHASFSYLASGPPGHRLEELLALSDAGLVRFLGPEVRVRAEEGVGFIADSPRVDASVRAAVLVDAWLPESQASQSVNPVLRELVERGTGAELAVSDADFTGTHRPRHRASGRFAPARCRRTSASDPLRRRELHHGTRGWGLHAPGLQCASLPPERRPLRWRSSSRRNGCGPPAYPRTARTTWSRLRPTELGYPRGGGDGCRGPGIAWSCVPVSAAFERGLLAGFDAHGEPVSGWGQRAGGEVRVCAGQVRGPVEVEHDAAIRIRSVDREAAIRRIGRDAARGIREQHEQAARRVPVERDEPEGLAAELELDFPGSLVDVLQSLDCGVDSDGLRHVVGEEASPG